VNRLPSTGDNIKSEDTMPTFDPHSYTDLSQGRIEHLELHIAVDFSARVLRIRADYQLAEPVSGSLFLDSRGLDIARVYADPQVIEFEKDARDPILGERLHLKQLDRAPAFTIELTTSPDATALQWLEPQQTAGGQQPFLYSQCQAIHARSIFPCQDTPSVRITYTAHLEVPSEVIAVMAAEHTGMLKQGRTSIYSFKMPQPIPFYLFAFAAGDLQFKDLGPRTGVYAEPAMLEAAAWEFAENEDKIVEAERLFGPYLWDRYDLLILPPSFPFGGMENPRLTFVTPFAVLGDRSRTDLISHELAHAWTGNLITNATWEDMWLNEGWTTYAEGRITEVVEGAALNQLSSRGALDALHEEIKRFGATSDRTCLKSPMKEVDPDDALSSVPYIKGAFFLLSLEQAVGRQVFDVFIKKYISRYSFQSLTTEEFESFLEQELPAAVARIDINEWLYAPGLPAQLPTLRSSLYDEVQAKVEAFEQGAALDPAAVRDWRRDQKLLFLMLIPQTMSPERCHEVETLLALHENSDHVLLTRFYRISIQSGYQEVKPGVERLVEKEGRLALLRRLFQCLAENDWSRDLARPLFERVRARYHPITTAAVDYVLAQAGV
jgi:aminopeptidase N